MGAHATGRAATGAAPADGGQALRHVRQRTACIRRRLRATPGARAAVGQRSADEPADATVVEREKRQRQGGEPRCVRVCGPSPPPLSPLVYAANLFSTPLLKK